MTLRPNEDDWWRRWWSLNYKDDGGASGGRRGRRRQRWWRIGWCPTASFPVPSFSGKNRLSDNPKQPMQAVFEQNREDNDDGGDDGSGDLPGGNDFPVKESRVPTSFIFRTITMNRGVSGDTGETGSVMFVVLPPRSTRKRHPGPRSNLGVSVRKRDQRKVSYDSSRT
ncbi:hypothetical protein L1987_78379 [Smallanthus sonchifolius]|uniref:Uncharacterized protein n=1 Tax=Smallanthus sonchifolius TaxID=185202 RepID=A0ACB8ZCQ6_9ASTR|nr:hypothetical protein L1987_78379 [Smallanthus sonchifolius]